MKALLLSIVLLFGVVMPVFAAVNLVVTGSRIEPNGDTRYSIRISNWFVSDTTYTPCGGEWDWTYRTCEVDVAGYDEVTMRYYRFTSWSTPSTSKKLTSGQVLANLGILIPLEQSVVVDKASQVTCFTLRVGNTAGMTPLSSCVPVKPPPVKCDITGSVTIDHKTLSDHALNNAQASTQLNVRCSASASVTVRATRTNSRGVRLRADESLYSVVTINNRDATGGINVTTTNTMSTPITVMSTLNTQGTVAPGAFSGSTVITVSPN